MKLEMITLNFTVEPHELADEKAVGAMNAAWEAVMNTLPGATRERAKIDIKREAGFDRDLNRKPCDFVTIRISRRGD